MPFLVAIVLGVFVLQKTMAKELPYYQFEPAQYLTKDISFCSLEMQGLFTNICAYYWQRECKLTRDQFLRRLNHPKLFDELVSEGIIDLKENDIIIKFLDAQYEKATRTSKTNSINGSKGGRPKKETELKPNLKPNDNPNKSETKGIREEKIIEDKKKQEDKNKKKGVPPSFDSFLNHAQKKAKEKNIFLDTEKVKTKFEAWLENGWCDLNGKRIINWKVKITSNLTYWQKVGANNKPITGDEHMQITF
jgi:hypothetical protein